MDSTIARPGKLPLVWIVIGVITAAVLIAGIAYLNRPVAPPHEAPASEEAKAYVQNLALSNVEMKAAENFMKQQVVEIDGKISNNGNRRIRSVDVFCMFYSVDGKEVHRERVPIVHSQGNPLGPGQTRDFRLPFDSLPDGWNQTMPRLAIAQITFAK
ncbi:MAG: FxLYD domain-containing protein [Bryobacteraceae bacterium]